MLTAAEHEGKRPLLLEAYRPWLWSAFPMEADDFGWVGNPDRARYNQIVAEARSMLADLRIPSEVLHGGSPEEK